MMKYTDEELLQILWEDREAGAAKVMEQYAGLVWTVCSKRLQNKEDIKECVNTVFAEFCLHYEKFDSEKGELKNYLCMIADRRAMDMFRVNSRRKDVEKALVEKQMQEMKEREQVREYAELEDAFEQLEPVDAQILRMKYYDGMAYKEIAKQLDMSYESVKKRGQRSKQRLLYLLMLIMIFVLLVACTAVVFEEYHVWEHLGIVKVDDIEYDVANETGMSNSREKEQQLKSALGQYKPEVTMIEEAAPVVQTYQFSSMEGFIWSCEEIYELTKNTQTFEKSGIEYEVADATYQTGELNILFIYSTTDKSEESHKWWEEGRNVCKNAYVLQENGEKIYNIEIESKPVLDANLSKFEAEVTYECELAEVEDGVVQVQVALEGDKVFELTLSKLQVQEYEEPQESFSLSEEVQLITGPCIIEDGIATISLYQDNIEAYKITELITNSYLGVGERTLEKPYLTDVNGNKYEMMRVISKDMKTEAGTRRVFEIAFQNMEVGTYTLHIPYFCIEKNQVSEKQKITLPTAENPYLECDETVAFPDGSAIHITGVERIEVEGIRYNGNDDGTITEIPCLLWQYKFTYELLSEDKLEFCSVLGSAKAEDGTEISGAIDIDNKFMLETEIRGDFAEVEIQFKRPVYIYEETFETNIEIQEVIE